MKKYFNVSFGSLLSVLLMALAVVTGGGAMAVAITDEGPDPNTSQNPGTASDASNSNGSADPAHPEAADRLSPGGVKDGQDLTGTQASASQIRKGGLAEDEWDNELVQFRPWNTPFLSLVRRVAKTYQTQGYQRKHMRNGGETLEAKITADTTAGTTLVLRSTGQNANVVGNLRPFYKGTKIYCLGVAGYAPGSQTVRQGTLTLIVSETNKNFTEVTCYALNGPAATAGEQYITDELDCRTVPVIPAGTTLAAGAVSMSESQLLVTPENYRPSEHEVYLQKKGFNIIFTDEYEKIKKKQPLSVANIKADTILKYNLRAERDYFMGVKARWNTTNEDGSVEYAYSAEGVIPQITQNMTVDGKYTFGILGAINMAQFTEFSAHNVAYAFAGKAAMQQLNTLELPKGYEHCVETVKEFDIDFKKYTDTFGTMYYTWSQTLDMLGLEDCIVVLDLKGLVRYVHLAEKEQTNDMSKGAGEIRDAKRLIKTEADCLALRGYNSLFVGPTAKVTGFNTKNTTSDIQFVDALPATPAAGDKIAPSAAFTDANTGIVYKPGVVYIYNGSAWNTWKGVDVA